MVERELETELAQASGKGGCDKLSKDGLTRSDTTEEEVNTSYLPDGSLVILALLVQVLGISIQDVCVLGAGSGVSNLPAPGA